MVKHSWSILAQSSVTDSRTNVFSIQSVLERVSVGVQAVEVPQEVVIPLNAELVTFLFRDDPAKEESAKISFIFTDSKGEILMQGEQQVQIEKGKRNVRVVGKLNAIKLRGNGIYHLKISLDDEHVQTLPLEVVITPAIER